MCLFLFLRDMFLHWVTGEGLCFVFEPPSGSFLKCVGFTYFPFQTNLTEEMKGSPFGEHAGSSWVRNRWVTGKWVCLCCMQVTYDETKKALQWSKHSLSRSLTVCWCWHKQGKLLVLLTLNRVSTKEQKWPKWSISAHRPGEILTFSRLHNKICVSK